jgi:hypothetical protein
MFRVLATAILFSFTEAIVLWLAFRFSRNELKSVAIV